MMTEYNYSLTVKWTGNKGTGTNSYINYDRSHLVLIEGKPELKCSSDAAFRGDKTKYTPEDFLVASISGCHMLWYLHLCSENGIIVTDYIDNAIGTMIVEHNGAGRFSNVTLYPEVTLTNEAMQQQAAALHKNANALCFIANSCNFPITHHPTFKIKSFDQ